MVEFVDATVHDFGSECGAVPKYAAALERAHQEHLELMDALVEAGYRPVTFRRSTSEGQEPQDYWPPGDVPQAQEWEIETSSRLVAPRGVWAACRDWEHAPDVL